MPARQFKPFSYQANNIPLIVYPVKDENPIREIFQPANEESIKKHLDQLYKSWSKLLAKGSYHILFVWNLDKHKMVDVWLHDMKNFSDSGPLIECITFRDLERCSDAGIASGDSLIALAREEELRRRVNNLSDYLDRVKCQPEFPDDLQPQEKFGATNAPKALSR